jgi:methanogenic corrinoid protein MtbC1
MKSTIDAIREAGIETPIIIGGGRVDDDVQEYVGANAWADDAATGVRLSKELVGAN